MGGIRSVFRIDPGWLFILAGVAICAAGVLIPAQTDLLELHRQRQELRKAERFAWARLQAYQEFRDELKREDPALIRRLAAAQLNVVPAGATAVLRSPSSASVTDWIDATVPVDRRPPQVMRESTLAGLANGPRRLWFLAAGVLAVFIGLVVDPSMSSRPRPKSTLTPPWRVASGDLALSSPRRVAFGDPREGDGIGRPRFT